MVNILDDIIRTKRREVASAKQRRSEADVRAAAANVEPARDFLAAITASAPGSIQLIAETKKASPSAGVIHAIYSPARIAREYGDAGAAAISVLTDETYFSGHLDHVALVKRAVDLPVLRKDFIVDAYQVFQSRAAGADAILLIAEVLSPDEVVALCGISHKLGMGTLIEAHGANNLAATFEALTRIHASGWILGINNRDLAAQRTDVQTTVELATQLPEATPFVSESGIATRADVETIIAAGARAMLVGESILRASDMPSHIRSLLGR